jgi:hypothetical protein
MKNYLIAILIFMSQVASADAGFYDIDSILEKNISNAFVEFPVDHDCGSVRIHKNKPYYLTALHCLRKAFSNQSERTIGSPLNYDSLVYYADLTNKIGTIGNFKLRVLANGRCWTGFGLDVFATSSTEEIKAGADCLQGDWVIFERLDTTQSASDCVDVQNDPAKSSTQVITLGGPRLQIKRNTGLQNLTGRVFSKGQTHSIDELFQNPNFPKSIVPLWKKILDVTDISKNLIVTDSDIINGMSGGPVFQGKFLIGISTVALLPNFIYDYSGLISMNEGYNFGIHGAIPVAEIQRSNKAYFDCK